MSPETTSVVTATSKKAAAAVVEASPVVTEVVESILENPAAVARTVQWGVIGVSVVAGAGLGAVGLWGFNKFRSVRSSKKVDPIFNVGGGIDGKNGETLKD